MEDKEEFLPIRTSCVIGAGEEMKLNVNRSYTIGK